MESLASDQHENYIAFHMSETVFVYANIREHEHLCMSIYVRVYTHIHTQKSARTHAHPCNNELL